MSAETTWKFGVAASFSHHDMATLPRIAPTERRMQAVGGAMRGGNGYLRAHRRVVRCEALESGDGLRGHGANCGTAPACKKAGEEWRPTDPFLSRGRRRLPALFSLHPAKSAPPWFEAGMGDRYPYPSLCMEPVYLPRRLPVFTSSAPAFFILIYQNRKPRDL